jgi:hypothetical protein
MGKLHVVVPITEHQLAGERFAHISSSIGCRNAGKGTWTLPPTITAFSETFRRR